MPSFTSFTPLALLILPCLPATLLLLLSTYHVLPLLPLLRSLGPSLTALIPHPHRRNLLPREFFNLPPREDDELDQASRSSLVRKWRATPWSARLGVRGCIMALLLAQAVVSLITGWVYLAHSDSTALLAISITALPSTVLAIALGTIQPSNNILATLLGTGITHTTVFRRTFPTSLIPTTIVAIIASQVDELSVLVGTTSFLSLACTVAIALSGWRHHHPPPTGAIRLSSPSPAPLEKVISFDEDEDAVRAGSDWLTSPSQDGVSPVSSFSYPSSVQTPRPKPRSTTVNGSPTSWLSSPTNSPNSIPEWSYSPSTRVPSPQPAHVRDTRSPSPSPSHASAHFVHPNLPHPPSQRPIAPKASTATMYTASSYAADQSGLSPGGSIIGGYDPDPFHPLPRRFESLSSYPVSPGQHRASQLSFTERHATSTDTLACVPVQVAPLGSRVGSAAWTLESYHSAMEDPRSPPLTPGGSRRPAPPPPIPTDLPLPPTPTLTRGESPWEWTGKDSSELLISDRDWVQIESGSEGVDGWGESGRGAGLVGLVGVLACFALDLPLLLRNRSIATLALFTVALMLPAPLLVLTSYLLRYRLPKTRSRPTSTHRSLALVSNSQLSLPVSISPKLTPPSNHHQCISTPPNTRLSKLIVPRPSTSDFGFARTPRTNKRHTVYGVDEVREYERDLAAEAQLRRAMARRSADVWVEAGHAKAGMGLWARAAEMIKPVPAMRVLDSTPKGNGILTRLRGGVVSMVPTRRDQDMEMGPVPGPTISITSPSKYDRARASYISSTTDDHHAEVDGDNSLPHAEIQMATRARRSGSPSFIFPATLEDAAASRRSNSYDIDWLSAGVIPGLLPTVKLGADVRVQPMPVEGENVRPSFENAITSTPGRAGHTRGYSSSVDFTRPSFDSDMPTPRTPRVRQRRHKTLSLPGVDSILANSEIGIDLPPIPQTLVRLNALSTLIEDTEATRQAAYEANRSIERNAALARRLLGESSIGYKTSSEFSSPSPSLLSDAEAAKALLAVQSISKFRSKVSYRLDSDTEPPTSPGSDWVPPDNNTFGVAPVRPVSNYSAETGWADDAEEEDEPRWLDGRAPQLSSSLASADEAGAEEMEAVLAMDTPTRAEFVISPPPPSAASGTEHTPSSASVYTTTSYIYTDSDDSPVPPIPPIPAMYRPFASHPHPPPLPTQALGKAIPLPPLRDLSHRPSAESMHSDSTGYTTSDAASVSASVGPDNHARALSQDTPSFNPTREQLDRVQRLRERLPPPEPEGSKPATGGRGLRPLQLVSVAGGHKVKLVGEEGKGSSATKASTGSGKISVATGKENTPAGKKSKASMTSSGQRTAANMGAIRA